MLQRGIFMALFQNGIDVSRYQGSINWTQVAAAGKQFAIVRVGSSNSGGLYVDPYFCRMSPAPTVPGCGWAPTTTPMPAPALPLPAN